MAFAASNALPPPKPTTRSQPRASAACAPRCTSRTVGSPGVENRVAAMPTLSMLSFNGRARSPLFPVTINALFPRPCACQAHPHLPAKQNPRRCGKFKVHTFSCERPLRVNTVPARMAFRAIACHTGISRGAEAHSRRKIRRRAQIMRRSFRPNSLTGGPPAADPRRSLCVRYKEPSHVPRRPSAAPPA